MAHDSVPNTVVVAEVEAGQARAHLVAPHYLAQVREAAEAETAAAELAVPGVHMYKVVALALVEAVQAVLVLMAVAVTMVAVMAAAAAEEGIHIVRLVLAEMEVPLVAGVVPVGRFLRELLAQAEMEQLADAEFIHGR